MANSFTPQEIEQFLQEFFDVVGARQYVGARYVPIFGRAGSDTVEWDDLAPYEPLTVVMHRGVSYVSRRYVPAGIPIRDTDYWVETYRFNAQVEQYRQEVRSFQGQIDEIRDDYVPFPDAEVFPKYGTLGQVLTTLSDGSTKWEDPVVPSDAQAEEVITQWLDDHPEATTTVLDNSLTTAKYKNGSVTDEKLAQSGGILDTVSALAANLVMDSKGMSQFLRPTNLIVPSDCVDNKYVNTSNGSLVNYADYFVTGFIPVTAGTTYKANVMGRRHAWYNADKTYVSGSDRIDFRNGVTAPSDVAYLRFTINKSTDYDSPYEIYFATSASYDPTILLDVENANVSQTAWNIPWVVRFPNNIVVPDECLDNHAIGTETGVVVDREGYFCTGFLAVTAEETYKANVPGRWHAWYDASKAFLSGATTFNLINGETVPVGAAYLRFTINKTNDVTDPHLVYCAKESDYDNNITIPTLRVEPTSWCNGKTINWIGDSIVDGQDFDEYVCSNLGMTKLTRDGVNGGINGSTIALDENGNDGRHALCLRYVNMPANADIIAVSCGTNDWMYAWCPIGDMTSTANNTFYGALKTLCTGLIDMYPKKVIFFTTPIKRAQAFVSGAGGTYTPDDVNTDPTSKNKYGLTLGDYGDIIKEVCAYYSIPVLDMYNECLLNPSITSQQDMFDSALTHPNTDGQKIMARRVCGWLTQLGYDIS